jgi:23S rRNA (adenine2503-C2)-methyltransferase
VEATKTKIAITGFTLAKLAKEFEGLGKEQFRARQVFAWIYQKGVTSFAQMTDLSKNLRAFLEENYEIPRPELATQQDSGEDGTRKFLFRVGDGKTIETVLIPAKDRLTQCVSSQVGCAMACQFCNTGDMGLMRNLKTHEIIDQILESRRQLDRPAEEIFGHKRSNVVFMGMGEPFHNLDAVIDAVEILTCDYGFGLSQRKITVSTSGLVPSIDEFGKRSNANLAISLNATTDELRSEIMPVNKRWPLAELMAACRRYPLKANRRITFEYVLLNGLNDTLDDARRITQLLQGIPSKINLIPYNPHPSSPFERPELEKVYAMQKYLLNRGWNCTVRISKGRDILAACGQLRSAEIERSKHRERAERARVSAHAL